MTDVEKTAIKMMLGVKHPEWGEYTLYYSPELYLDTNYGKYKDMIAELLDKDMIEVVVIPESEFDNHCGLKLKYKGEK